MHAFKSFIQCNDFSAAVTFCHLSKRFYSCLANIYLTVDTKTFGHKTSKILAKINVRVSLQPLKTKCSKKQIVKFNDI